MQQVGVWSRLATKSPIQEITLTVVYGNTSGELHLPASGSAGQSSPACRIPPRPNATATRWRSARFSPASTPALSPGLRLHRRRDFASARFPDTSPPHRVPAALAAQKAWAHNFLDPEPLAASPPTSRSRAATSPQKRICFRARQTISLPSVKPSEKDS